MNGACKFPNCTESVVGHSTTGEGKVCHLHNLQEWGEALSRSRGFQDLGRVCLVDAEEMQRRLGEAHARLCQPQLELPLGHAA